MDQTDFLLTCPVHLLLKEELIERKKILTRKKIVRLAHMYSDLMVLGAHDEKLRKNSDFKRKVESITLARQGLDLLLRKLDVLASKEKSTMDAEVIEKSNEDINARVKRLRLKIEAFRS